MVKCHDVFHLKLVLINLYSLLQELLYKSSCSELKFLGKHSSPLESRQQRVRQVISKHHDSSSNDGADAQTRPQAALQSEAAGVGNATSGSLTDKLTREHRLTVDEARLILNLKKEDPLEHTLRVRLHLKFFTIHPE